MVTSSSHWVLNVFHEPLEEYKSLNDNIRWYSNLCFAQLPLFIAITAALTTGISDNLKPPAIYIHLPHDKSSWFVTAVRTIANLAR